MTTFKEYQKERYSDWKEQLEQAIKTFEVQYNTRFEKCFSEPYRLPYPYLTLHHIKTQGRCVLNLDTSDNIHNFTLAFWCNFTVNQDGVKVSGALQIRGKPWRYVKFGYMTGRYHTGKWECRWEMREEEEI